MTTNDIPEGLELRKDGTVVFHIDDEAGRSQRINLRRPKMRELRDFRQAEWDIADEISVWIDATRTEIQDLDLPADDAEIDPAKLKAARDINLRVGRESTALSESLRLPWIANVLGVLGGRTVEEDDLPPWAATPELARDLIGHWLQVPTRRGSR